MGRGSEESELAPVRQSRRIAQMKIKEEAERRHLEELALREMKKIHKKKVGTPLYVQLALSSGQSAAERASSPKVNLIPVQIIRIMTLYPSKLESDVAMFRNGRDSRGIVIPCN